MVHKDRWEHNGDTRHYDVNRAFLYRGQVERTYQVQRISDKVLILLHLVNFLLSCDLGLKLRGIWVW